MLQQLARDHSVEARIRERKLRLDVGEDGLDTKFRRGLEGHSVDV